MLIEQSHFDGNKPEPWRIAIRYSFSTGQNLQAPIFQLTPDCCMFTVLRLGKEKQKNPSRMKL
jgi:hypothetical protein